MPVTRGRRGFKVTAARHRRDGVTHAIGVREVVSIPEPGQQPESWLDFEVGPLPPMPQGSSRFPSLTPASDPASIRAEADPVALRNGEFVHRAVDLEVLGGKIPFGLVRTYRSRMTFGGIAEGASWGWDHNLNARIYFNSNSMVCTSDVTVSIGFPTNTRPSIRTIIR